MGGCHCDYKTNFSSNLNWQRACQLELILAILPLGPLVVMCCYKYFTGSLLIVLLNLDFVKVSCERLHARVRKLNED